MRPVCGVSFCAPQSRTCSALLAVLGASLHPNHLVAESLGNRPHPSPVTRALVIGGAGFIGTAACKELMRRGVETIAAGRTPRPYGTFTSYRTLDRSQPEAVIEEVRPDIVLDLVGGDPLPVDRQVVVACGNAQPPVPALRAGAVLGPEDPTLRIAQVLRLLESGEPVPVPEQTFEQPAALAWVKDLGYACALACAADQLSGLYEVVFEQVSLRALVEALARAVGTAATFDPRPVTEAMPYRIGPPNPAEVERARRELGFRPSALEDALPEILAWYRVRRASLPARA